jgi:CRP-like cAMP-binding protein
MQLDPSAFVADPELVAALAKRATPVDCDVDRVLFQQGEMPAGIYILRKGRVTLSMNSTAGEVILSLQISAGSLMGLPGLLGDRPYTLTAVARAGAQVSFIPRAEFTGFMQSDPMVAFKVLQVLAAEVSAARRAISV